MNKTLLAALTPAERHLVSQTEPAALAELDEDGAADLHDRIRRARNKYTGLYRRGASARVAKKGARGAARPANQQAALKAEAFEEALSRVSRRLAVLSRESARALKEERLAAARGQAPAAPKAPAAGRTKGRAVAAAPRSSRRNPASEKARASTKATGARRQAKRDAR